MESMEQISQRRHSEQQSTSSCSFVSSYVFRRKPSLANFLPKLLAPVFAVLASRTALLPLDAPDASVSFHGAHITRLAVCSGPAAAVCHCTLRATMHQDVATHSKSHC